MQVKENKRYTQINQNNTILSSTFDQTPPPNKKKVRRIRRTFFVELSSLSSLGLDGKGVRRRGVECAEGEPPNLINCVLLL